MMSLYRPVLVRSLVSEKSKRCHYVAYSLYSWSVWFIIQCLNVNTTKRSCTRYVEMYCNRIWGWAPVTALSKGQWLDQRESITDRRESTRRSRIDVDRRESTHQSGSTWVNRGSMRDDQVDYGLIVS